MQHFNLLRMIQIGNIFGNIAKFPPKINAFCFTASVVLIDCLCASTEARILQQQVRFFVYPPTSPKLERFDTSCHYD